MPTYTIKKNGQLYNKTADTREEAIAFVEDYAARQMDLADSQLDALDGEQVQPSAPEPKQDEVPLRLSRAHLTPSTPWALRSQHRA